MRKYFCDSCKKEIERANHFSVPVHILSTGLDGHADFEFNKVSSKRRDFDLCNKCLNTAYTAAVEAVGLK